MHTSAAPLLNVWPHDLLKEHHLTVTSQHIASRGQLYPVPYGAQVDAETEEPRAFPSLALLCLAVLALPFAMAAKSVWLTAFPVGMLFAAGARLLSAETTYRVVLRAAGRAVTLYESRDERLIIALTAAVRTALDSR